ncbi:tRNA methyl transferase-domain-containing protein [Kalaharituber pfeilii]|nr:tRNA methyl transferase-domain-containing protein [Kalaharituber pfeilii]
MTFIGSACHNSAFCKSTLWIRAYSKARRWVSGPSRRSEYVTPKPERDDKGLLGFTLKSRSIAIDSHTTVFIALSSGIDSSVTAKLLSMEHPIENLYPLYMVNWNPANEKCTTREFRQVEELCKFLGLRQPMYMNFEKEYWNEVFVPMVEEYERGWTPNPDVGCNRWVKFGGLLKRLEREVTGKRKWWLATGHYAHIGYPSNQPEMERTIPHLLRSMDPNKDQTFYLSTIDPACLPRLLFPLSAYGFTKPDVYKLARRWSLPGWEPGAVERQESMGLCYVEPGGGQGTAGFRLFLNEFLEPKLGDKAHEEGVLLECGTVIGKHDGLWTATVGEKAHLNLPQGDKRFQGRWYVSRKNINKNQIEVVRGWSNGRLWSSGMIVRDWYWLGTDCKSIAQEALAIQQLNDGSSSRDDHETWENTLVVQFRHRQRPIRVINVELSLDSSLRTPSLNQRDRGSSPANDKAKHCLHSSHVKIMFESPQRAVALGQSAAMWWGERCLGGGIIEETVDPEDIKALTNK